MVKAQKVMLKTQKHRIFKLGNERVKERQSYDHVGVKACLYKANNSRVEEKIIKARRAFNACAGIGIRKSGLTMLTCNIIYWSIVVPILTFGSEIWCLSEHDYGNLISFQRLIGKRIQRFPSRAQNSSSFFGLGWMRIPTYIVIKKLLFIMTFLRLKDNSIIKQVFIKRVQDFKSNRVICSENRFDSSTFEMLNAATKLGVFNMIYDMCIDNKPLLSKQKWSQCVWTKAWQIEDIYWSSTSILHKDNDLLVRTIVKNRYHSWWDMSDKYPHMIKICETMAKLVSHASKLKGDDLRLKQLLQSHKACSECDFFYLKEDLFHIVMQCLKNDPIRSRCMMHCINIMETYECYLLTTRVKPSIG